MSRRGPIVAGVASAVIALLAVVMLVLPKMGQVSEAGEALQVAEDQEISLSTQLRALQEAQAEAPETEAQIARIEDQVPPTADLPALFRLLQAAADRAAVDFFSFTPGTPALDPSGTFSTVGSQITVTGGYFAIDEMLFLLETLPRAAKVTTVAITPSAGDTTGTTTTTNALQLQLTVQFYTTDVSAGPGSVPGPTEGISTVPGV